MKQRSSKPLVGAAIWILVSFAFGAASMVIHAKLILRFAPSYLVYINDLQSLAGFSPVPQADHAQLGMATNLLLSNYCFYALPGLLVAPVFGLLGSRPRLGLLEGVSLVAVFWGVFCALSTLTILKTYMFTKPDLLAESFYFLDPGGFGGTYLKGMVAIHISIQQLWLSMTGGFLVSMLVAGFMRAAPDELSTGEESRPVG